jgi:hypothetical protein
VGNWYYDGAQMAMSDQARKIVGEFLPYMRHKYRVRESAVYIDPACKALRLEIEKLGIQTQGADNNGHDIKGSTKGLKCGVEMLQSSINNNRFFLVEDALYGTEPFVKEAGLYSYDAYVSSGATTSSISLSLSNDEGTKDISEVIPVPCVQANNWDNYRAVHGRLLIPLEEGQQIIRINITGGSCNVDKIIFKKIDVDNNINISVTSDPKTATINENTTLSVSASSPTSTIANVKIYLDNVVLKSLTAEPFETTYRPTAKGTYNITAIATDAEGKQSKIAKYVLKVNNKRTAHKGVVNLPGIIEAENFDRGGEGFTYHDSDSKDEGGTNYRSDSEGVDIVTGNNSHALGYTAVNEWVEYSVNVTEGGKYAYKATVSSGVTGSGFTIGLVEDGKITSLCKVNVPQTGSNNWDTYKTVTGYLSKNLEAGNQILRFTINGANCNIDKVEFICTVSDGLEVVTTAEAADNTTYNLYGIKVGADYKGIVIRNGKKYLNK